MKSLKSCTKNRARTVVHDWELIVISCKIVARLIVHENSCTNFSWFRTLDWNHFITFQHDVEWVVVEDVVAVYRSATPQVLFQLRLLLVPKVSNPILPNQRGTNKMFRTIQIRRFHCRILLSLLIWLSLNNKLNQNRHQAAIVFHLRHFASIQLKKLLNTVSIVSLSSNKLWIKF